MYHVIALLVNVFIIHPPLPFPVRSVFMLTLWEWMCSLSIPLSRFRWGPCLCLLFESECVHYPSPSPVFGEVRVYTYSLLVNVFIIHPSLPFSVGSVFLLFLAYRVFFYLHLYRVCPLYLCLLIVIFDYIFVSMTFNIDLIGWNLTSVTLLTKT